MLAYVILAAIVITGFVFAIWLGAFILNRGMNTNLETARESSRITSTQLAYGAVLLGILLLFGFIYTQIDREPLMPPLNAGKPFVAGGPAATSEVLSTTNEAAERASLVFVGIFVSGLGFILWLGVFLLNQSIDTAFVSGPEGERRAARQLSIGGILLAMTVTLTFVFFQIDRTALVPNLDAPQPLPVIPQDMDSNVPDALPEATDSTDGAATEPESLSDDVATPAATPESPETP